MAITKTGSRIRRLVAIAAMALVLAALTMVGCSSSNAGSQSSSQAANLQGQQLNIYCGAGMTEPFQKIADLFTEETGCEMNVTYANAAQIQTQITTTNEGDFFIAGSKEELKPVESAVASSEDLVKHIPVLAVPASNPANITASPASPTLSVCSSVTPNPPYRQNRQEGTDRCRVMGLAHGLGRHHHHDHRTSDRNRSCQWRR